MLLDVRNISFGYSKDELCFKELNFCLKRGENLAILGLNGQGKSTLLYNLMGILKPTNGQICINSSYSYLPQIFSLAFEYSVLDVVLMGRAANLSLFQTPSKEDMQIAHESLLLLGISNLQNQSFNSLSGGQKQLVLFARAISSKAEILFLDEPASALDLKNQDRVLSLIKKLNSKFNLSVVLTTHQPNHALSIADKTLIMYDDLSYIFGKTEEILTETNQQKLYQIHIRNIDITYKNKSAKSSVAVFKTQMN